MGRSRKFGQVGGGVLKCFFFISSHQEGHMAISSVSEFLKKPIGTCDFSIGGGGGGGWGGGKNIRLMQTE